MAESDPHILGSVAEIEALYGQPLDRSLWKELDHISDHYRAFIEVAPFVALASSGSDGLDCSPCGDPAGFVRVADPKTVMLPDRRGNNRLDTLKNIVTDPRVALLFLITGVGETMRINGTAVISTDPGLCEGFTMNGKVPRSVIMVTVGSVYYQCSKALIRSRLWEPEARIDHKTLPSGGQMIKAVAPEPFDAAYPKRVRQTIY